MSEEFVAVTLGGDELTGEGIKALHTLVSLMAESECSFCDSLDDLQYEYLIMSTLCSECRELYSHWLKLNSGALKSAFSNDIKNLRETRERLLNLPEVRTLRENLNKDN